MIIALIIALFAIQLITIFIIVLLYGKLSKFKTLEARQNQLVEEMDNALGVYLLEMKEENDRFLQQLSATKVAKAQQPLPQVTKEQRNNAPVIDAKKILNELTEEPKRTKQPQTQQDVQAFEARKFVPVQKATTAYSKQKAQTSEAQELEQVEAQLFQPEKQELTFEQQAVAYYKAGKSIEEIARMMQRGKTEIELLVKFHA